MNLLLIYFVIFIFLVTNNLFGMQRYNFCQQLKYKINESHNELTSLQKFYELETSARVGKLKTGALANYLPHAAPTIGFEKLDIFRDVDEVLDVLVKPGKFFRRRAPNECQGNDCLSKIDPVRQRFMVLMQTVKLAENIEKKQCSQQSQTAWLKATCATEIENPISEMLDTMQSELALATLNLEVLRSSHDKRERFYEIWRKSRVFELILYSNFPLFLLNFAVKSASTARLAISTTVATVIFKAITDLFSIQLMERKLTLEHKISHVESLKVRLSRLQEVQKEFQKYSHEICHSHSGILTESR